ncbi:hypothetical protein AGABI2DRAFT_195600 [Agaricus bisporus var. bisporus H97]|uniref:hypothetical protein n=1 Tax=Agaricus bisporus var. bisporus (strain H97 / ATCC MYA-4626 / FGSC 10389) TaxID=936046 RepID=UPI00029F6706|nr:hypothetical protein AGABI2DRAFT_195600 [Agaricus bisporus var. bisporus H97]EKV42814.1 hypothetical protein AGABI2DRAFT_195600 [Agaricus bisporus var. bisporus H97]
MGDFPWEIIKAETLRFIARDLGIKRNLKRDETIAFLRSVQKRGLGPALVEVLSRDIGHATSTQDDEADSSSPATPTPPTPPSARTRSKPIASPSRRTSSRKRPAQEMEPSSLTGNEDEDEDAEGETDVGMDIEPVSISASRRNAPSRNSKRVRLSDPGPPPARSTRSKGAAQNSVSAMTLRSSPRSSSTKRATQARERPGASKKRTSRPSRIQAPVEENEEEGEDADAEGEDDIESEEEAERTSTGAGALAAVLTRASMQSRTPRRRGRPRKVSQKQVRVSKPRVTRPRPQPSVTSHSHSGPSADINVDSPRPKRISKPTAKAALLGASKRPMSILSKAVRPSKRSAGAVLSRVRFGAGELPEGAKEVFDGVVLKKRISRGSDRDVLNGVIGYQSRGLQLDEFVANGIERQSALENGHDDAMLTSDPVLDREDASTLGGSNKENDFSFRDVSESSDGRAERVLMGEEDAEGESEHEMPLNVNPSTVMQELSQLQHQTDQLNLNDVQRPLFPHVPRPEAPQPEAPQTQVLPVVSGFEINPFAPEPQLQFQAQVSVEFHAGPQSGPSGQQLEPQQAAETAPSEQEPVVQSVT